MKCFYGLVLGQSLGVGETSLPALTTAQAYSRERTFVGGVRADANSMGSTIPLVESDDVASNYGETVCSSATNWQVTARLARGIDPADPAGDFFFSSTGAVAGQALTNLTKGGTYYLEEVAHVTAGWACAEALGATAMEVVVWWQHGETDAANNTPRAIYSAGLVQFQKDFLQDTSAATGLDLAVPYLIMQTEHLVADYPDITLAQFDACSSPGFYFVGPAYIFPHTAAPDMVHLTNAGEAWAAAYFGRATNQLRDTGSVDTLAFVGCSVRGVNLKIKLNVPNLPLQFNTTDIGEVTAYGFTVHDDLGPISLSAPIIAGSEVHFTLSRETLPEHNPHIRYGLDYLAAGVNITRGASGNVCDSTPDTVVIASTTRALYHWLRHLDEPVTVLGLRQIAGAGP